MSRLFGFSDFRHISKTATDREKVLVNNDVFISAMVFLVILSFKDDDYLTEKGRNPVITLSS